MEFENSDHVDSQTVAESCSTRLSVRKSRYGHLAERASEVFLKEWKSACGTEFLGCQSPVTGHIISLGLPEMSPTRISVITKLSDFLILLTNNKSGALNSTKPQEFLLKSESSSTQDHHDWETPQKQIWSKILVQILSIDRIRGKMLIEAFDTFRSSFGSQQASEIKDWDEWLAYRWKDGACHPYLTTIVYACELNLTQSDIDSVQHIAWKGMAVTTLSNDMYSFEIEATLELQAGGNLNNGVWKLMDERDITAKEAKHVLLEEKILPLEEEFMCEKSAFIRDHGRRLPELARYLELVELMVSGNWYWGSGCPRYHQWRKQLSYFGIEKLSMLDIRTFDESIDKCNAYLDVVSSHVKSLSKAEDWPSNGAPLTKKTNLKCRELHLDEKHISGPISYLQSLPSKNVRGLLIESLTSWFEVPPNKIERIEKIISSLHHASLLLDDIEDDSPLRRGKPTAHRIFGHSQTINSANFLYVQAVEQVLQLTKDSQEFFMVEMKKLHIGQSHDLYWAQTGGMFAMIGGLIYAETETPISRRLCKPRISEVSDIIKYEKEKGFAEDLDEGKFSLPLIHLLENSPDRSMIEQILQNRRQEGRMPTEFKNLLLEKMTDCRSLLFIKETMLLLESQAKDALGVLERKSGTQNYMLQYLIMKLADV
ncbi:unnamed protein product [Penicillium bialowiezense]